MALPTSRNTSYAPTDPPKSADLNDIQDQIIGLFGAKHGELELLIHASGCMGRLAPAASEAHYGQDAGLVLPPAWGSAAAAQTFVDVPIALRAGDRVKSIEIYLEEDSSSAIIAKIFEMNPSTGAITQKSGNKNSGTTGGFASVSWTDADADVPLSIQSARLYYVEVQLPATSADMIARVLGARITYDRP